MLQQPVFMVTDEQEIAALLRRWPWATMISPTAHGLVVSHLPIVTEGEGVRIVSHLAREDAAEHELGQHEIVLIVSGPNGYLSPTWYEETPHVPTWDFVVIHLHGVPEVLDDDQTWDVLGRTVEELEAPLPRPFVLASVQQYARRLAPAVVGFRLVPNRVVCKAKLSQDESPWLRRHAVRALREPGPYRNDALAELIEATLTPDQPPVDHEVVEPKRADSSTTS